MKVAITIDSKSRMRKMIPAIIIFVVAFGAFSIFSWKHMKNKYLRAGFPTSILFKNKTLLQPANLETTQEYYLLENLSATLIRYSEDLSSEFLGYLAESWSVSNHIASFRLKEDLRWSDGAKITCDEVASHFKRLTVNPHRHLQAIKKVKGVNCDPTGNEINFVFDSKPPITFFHELTLADTGLIKPLIDQRSWSVTSGPYFVSNLDIKKSEVILEKNSFVPMELNKDIPSTVLLREIPFNLKNPMDNDREESVDYIAPQGWSFLPVVGKLLDVAPHKIEGQPSLVHFISFIHASEAVRDIVKVSVFKANSKTELIPIHTSPYGEVIPPGYNGYLNNAKPEIKSVSKIESTELTIIVRPQYDALTAWMDQLKLEAAQLGVNITVEFGDITEPLLGRRHGNIAILGVFKGNMKDPIGSWSFLSDSTHGALRGYASEIVPILSKAADATDHESKSKLLKELHRDLLKKNIIIPLWCESLFMIHNERVSTINVNPFDFRIHFFQVQMK